MKWLLSLFVLCLLASSVLGDCYMQNPRGSNDRLNEENTNRDNAERLCDTQNNAKGGYCWGPPLYFYEGSLLSVEWTAQHGCGNPKVSCNIVLQYLCTDPYESGENLIRDGTTTDTIPNDETDSLTQDANGDYVYGMHENLEYYRWCQTRYRNMGLWISDRNVGDRAVNTRQNNGGTRHGFECTEERDYYPYWHPSPWKDVAVLIDDLDDCDFYQTESQNVKEKCYCWSDANDFYSEMNNEAACQSNGDTWKCEDGWGIDPPECLANEFSRDNHLGNVISGHTAQYNMTIMTKKDACGLDSGSHDDCICVLRIRYNMSSFDYDNDVQGSFTDAAYNGEASPVTEDPIVNQTGKGVILAIDTSQFFRTFQDRSYTFYVRSRPSSMPADSRVYNLNVRGKRGNIVETYPATEYDFIPGNVEVRVNDYIHFQWTGCDTNPQGNAGEGTAGTDRSNIVQIETEGEQKPATDDYLKENTPLFDSVELRQRMAYLGQTDCPSYEELLADNDNDENQADQDPRNCFKLNAAPAYFDGGAVKMNSTGTFYYISTRNNNFSNRDQKGTITVSRVLADWAIIVVAIGGALFIASIAVAGGMFYARSHPHSGVARLFNRM